MKIILSPVIYFISLVPLFLGTMLILSFAEGSFGFLFGLNGLIEIPLITITLGSLLFWFTNETMARIEKLHKPTILDHFRQSALFYLLGLYLFITESPLFLFGWYGGLGHGYILIALGICIWAIIINIFYLYQRRRAMAKNNQ